MLSLTNSYEDLITILEREFILCSEMVTLLQEEKDIMAGMDLEALDNHVIEKQLIAAKISMCEEARERMLLSLGMQGRTLSEIALTAGPDYHDRLAMLASKFKSITHSIAELNNLNGLLIERSLFYIKSSSRFLDSLGIKAIGKISVEA
jgi:flagellar biosynthesis/type III secretory pathway chaperone